MKPTTIRSGPMRFVVLVLLISASFTVLGQQASVSRSAGDYAERLARIERLLNSQALFELSNRVQALQLEVQLMRGELENQTYALEQMRNRQRDLYVDLDRRLQGRQTGFDNGLVADAGSSVNATGIVVDTANPPLEALSGVNPTLNTDSPGNAPASVVGQIDSGNGGFTVRSSTDPLPPTEAPAGPELVTMAAVTPGVVLETHDSESVPPVDETKAEASYRAALAFLKTGQYDQSIEAFNDFLVEYPSSAYADNAQYWLGEAYYVTRDFEPAMREYTKLVQAFPQSQKVEHALLKIGYSQQEMGNLSAAIAQLEEVLNLYPGSSAARKAQDRLQQLRLE